MLTPRSLGITLGLVVVVFGCGDGVGSKTDACQALQDCCDAMDGQERDFCNMAHDAAARSGTPRMSCDTLVESYRDQDLCNGSDGEQNDDDGVDEDPITGDGDGDGDSGHGVCDQYLHCAGTSSPGSLPSLLSTYGPDGTCWSSGESVKATCIEACANGLTELENANLCTDETDDDFSDEDEITIPDDDGEIDPIDELVYDYCAKVQACFPGQIENCELIGDQLSTVNEECKTALVAFMVCTVDALDCQDVGNCPNPNPACEGQ